MRPELAEASLSSAPRWLPWGACCAALLIGLPTLSGGFAGGDDQRLVLQHVLVSRPSLGHALELLTIPHRDLYQPVPLLSFSLEFALLKALGWRADLPWPDGGAWLFHLTNILLHTANTFLVWTFLRRMQPHTAIAGVAAVLFAIHPLQVEVIAWVNGRMMLLSTGFVLLTLISSARILKNSGGVPLVLCLLFALLAQTSKIRVSLPLLMLLTAWVMRKRPNARFLAAVASVGLMTLVLALVNVRATAESDMFANAEEQLKGSRIARSVLALGWYVQHLVWPSGLAPWYEAPEWVRWNDPVVWRAAAILCALLGVTAWAARGSRLAWAGLLWFLFSMASTLPLIPARNLLAADRYMYLPIIGLLMIVGAGYRLIREWMRPALEGLPPASRGMILSAAILAQGSAASALAAVGMMTTAYYRTTLAKTQRIVAVHPNSPYVHERMGWAYFELGEFEKAITAADEELRRHGDRTAAEALMLKGLSLARLGKSEEALESLRAAHAQAPENPMTAYRLATVLSDAGKNEEALDFFKDAMGKLKQFNPGILHAAAHARRMGERELARSWYERVLDNNAYDTVAPLALAEMALEEGRPADALARVDSLLAWNPEDPDARIHRGVILVRLGRPGEAEAEYRRVAAAHPESVEAWLNLGLLYRSAGAVKEAEWAFRQGLAADGVEALMELHDLLFEQGRFEEAAALWRERWAAAQHRQGAAARCVIALTLDDKSWNGGARAADDLPDDALPAGADRAAWLDGLKGLVSGRIAENDGALDGICGGTTEFHHVLRNQLLLVAQARSRMDPRNPWFYYMAARLLEADGRLQWAREGYRQALALCGDDAARQRMEERLKRLEDIMGEGQRN